MSFSSVRDFLTSVSARAGRAPRRRPTLGTRLGVEFLEDRNLLSWDWERIGDIAS
jgi:hypothetical protein